MDPARRRRYSSYSHVIISVRATRNREPSVPRNMLIAGSHSPTNTCTNSQGYSRIEDGESQTNVSVVLEDYGSSRSVVCRDVFFFYDRVSRSANNTDVRTTKENTDGSNPERFSINVTKAHFDNNRRTVNDIFMR